MKHPKRSFRDWWRVPRVGWYLLKRPQDIPFYIRYGVNTFHSPLDLGMLWWSFGATRTIEKWLRPEMEAFEFGSGGSSLFLALRTLQVTCVEDETKWVDLVRLTAARQGIKNLEVLHCPFDFHHTEKFRESSYLAALGTKLYDLIIVDGKEEGEPARPICFWAVEKNIKSGGVIVVDDSWRYPQIKNRHNAKHWHEYRGTGYCRAGVTSTCLFYY